MSDKVQIDCGAPVGNRNAAKDYDYSKDYKSLSRDAETATHKARVAEQYLEHHPLDYSTFDPWLDRDPEKEAWTAHNDAAELHDVAHDATESVSQKEYHRNARDRHRFDRDQLEQKYHLKIQKGLKAANTHEKEHHMNPNLQKSSDEAMGMTEACKAKNTHEMHKSAAEAHKRVAKEALEAGDHEAHEKHTKLHEAHEKAMAACMTAERALEDVALSAGAPVGNRNAAKDHVSKMSKRADDYSKYLSEKDGGGNQSEHQIARNHHKVAANLADSAGYNALSLHHSQAADRHQRWANESANEASRHADDGLESHCAHLCRCPNCKHEFNVEDAKVVSGEQAECPACGELMNTTTSRLEDCNSEAQAEGKGDEREEEHEHNRRVIAGSWKQEGLEAGHGHDEYKSCANGACASTSKAHESGHTQDHLIAARHHQLAKHMANRVGLEAHAEIHQDMVKHHRGESPNPAHVEGYDKALEACHADPGIWNKAKEAAGKEPYHGDTKYKVAQKIYENMHGALKSENAENNAENKSAIAARILVHTCNDELKASGANPDLNAVRHEVLRLHGVDLTCEQVGEYLMQPIEAKALTGGERDDLPDSAFMYIEPGGKKDAEGKTVPRSLRHLPYRNAKGEIDQAHLKNALARANQVDVPAHIKSELVKRAHHLWEKHGHKANEAAREGGKGIEASGTASGDARQQLDATGAALESGNTNDLRSMATLDNVIMYMPAGVHRITPSQGGKPVTVVVDVNELAAERIEEQRKALEASGNKPFFSVQHNTQIAAFWPSKFFWDKRLDATGSLVEGIFAEGEWTQAGREAVEGKNFRTFSPTFFVNKLSNDEDNPAEVVCNENAKLNMGALENDPAFQTISPLWAKRAGDNSIPAGVLVKKALNELKAEGQNPTLEAVQRQVNKVHRLGLTRMEVAEYLA